MVGLIVFTLIVIWVVMTEGNIFLRDSDDSDPTNQSID
jgi:hypothetical protein